MIICFHYHALVLTLFLTQIIFNPLDERVNTLATHRVLITRTVLLSLAT